MLPCVFLLLVICSHSFALGYQNDDNGLLGIILLMMWMGEIKNSDNVINKLVDGS